MKLPLALGVVLFVARSFAATPDYTITILEPDRRAAIFRPEYQASTNLVGKSIAAIFGPLSEVRVELEGANRTAIDGDTKKVEQKIRERIDRAKCLGRDSEVAWHKAPWVRGHLLLKNGRILPVQVWLSGIIVGDLLFTDKAENGAASGSQPIGAGTNRTSPEVGSQLLIVCEPRYYMVRDWGSGNLRLHARTNELSPFDVSGIVLEVIEPKPYSGMVFTVHHDSVFDPGDPLVGLALSNHYEFRAWPQDIGRFTFGPCSIDRVRKVPDRE